ncbi:MAG: glutamine-hydrolyzing carbamoyl-phosphate synthase small subunit [Peptostreptococcaceae bacterium]|nr:glutamine-hydrolyzing carbamoyl-phosphate synthase small subunit [Peptostreptococcaceae bacterium]
MKGIVYLEDGTVYKGKGFGHKGTKVGELVFNTAMTGYQKTMTDPSYMGQVIAMTYPLIGNYGINDIDNESEGIHAFGLVVKDVCFKPSNWRCIMNIDEWLKNEKIPGVYDVDTREITRKIRSKGTQKCVITTENLNVEQLKLICDEAELDNKQMKIAGVKTVKELKSENGKFKVAVMDLGVKKSILTELNKRGCDLTIFPYGTDANTILDMHPDGVFITNGPGDPEAAVEAIETTKKLILESSYGSDMMPIFGICMGHQLIGLAVGGKTFKLKYGHRGCNHGVFDKNTGKSYITSQNHGYSVNAESVILNGLDITHLNLNDGTVEGMEHISKPVFSVQFHPESSPGPNDTRYLFDKFIDLMEGGKL